MNSPIALIIFFLFLSVLGNPLPAQKHDEPPTPTKLELRKLPTLLPTGQACGPPDGPCKPWPFGYEDA
ncbi:hypothetical protein BCR34DRAFT_374307 [Clohesyomyces aquaticus]|uniref:Uncharacterized protein n=1 Tax=Clohesyomyces aquaticus TaxID=1231657 RepID=A0A1Y1ZGA4_9PLEO|nr:hypothetical protein BCR34DRAFT_374307 [Clohesyomyces aquaticus]